MSWWNSASTERRLAQIDGGIDCGMTARQIAMVSGASRHNVQQFASYHGRCIPDLRHGKSARRSEVARLKRAYWNEGARDFNDAPAVSTRVLDDDFDEVA